MKPIQDKKLSLRRGAALLQMTYRSFLAFMAPQIP